MSGLEIFGLSAALGALLAFVLNQYGKLSENSLWYDGLFLLSSTGLLFYAYKTGATPFMVLNGAWVIISLIEVIKDLVRIFMKSGRSKSAPSA